MGFDSPSLDEPLWNSEVLGKDSLAIHYVADGTDPRLLVASIDAQKWQRLPLKRLDEFLSLHETQMFVFVDVAKAFWGILLDLNGVPKEASSKLWGLADESRWIDLGILQCLIDHCENRSHKLNPNLTRGVPAVSVLKERRDRLIATYSRLQREGSLPQDCEAQFEPIVGENRELQEANREFFDRLVRLRSERNPTSVRPPMPNEQSNNETIHESTKKSGLVRSDNQTKAGAHRELPCGHGTQIRGAIALQAIRERGGLVIREEAAGELRGGLRLLYQRWSRDLEDCGQFDLRLMSWGDASGVPTSGNNLVIVGVDSNRFLHIRIFDSAGKLVTDTDETKLPASRTAACAIVKQQFIDLLPHHVLSGAKKSRVLNEVSSILGHTYSEFGSCFQWECRGEVKLSKSGYVETKQKELRDQLVKSSKILKDYHHEDVPIPRLDDSISPIPSDWGIWTSWDRSLRAWRNLENTAELLRWTDGRLSVIPRYTRSPAWGVIAPSLSLYRHIGVPIFQPRPGDVFLVCSLELLRLVTFTAVGLKNKIFTHQNSRLYGFFRELSDPLVEIARELANEHKWIQERGCHPHHPRDGDGTGNPSVLSGVANHESTNEPDSLAGIDYRADFPAEFINLAMALIDVLPLGLPTEKLADYLEFEYGVTLPGGVGVAKLVDALRQSVVYDFGYFLEDRVVNLIGAKRRLSAQEALRRGYDSAHMNTSPARIRKDLHEHRWAVKRRWGSDLDDLTPHPGDPQRRLDCKYRALTLSGRPTSRASQAVVRQQQVLLSANEILWEIAYSLVERGYRLCAVTGDSLVLEVAEASADEARGAVQRLVEREIVHLLGSVGKLLKPVMGEPVLAW
jgi:hypothetical protein